ncbi:hypothetical protein [Rhodopirellula europaea]|uniref:hypothetical protein n=1 Tax=Rhodopirellula europaea TaxID=1263866 RepID=UPI003D29E4E8
MKPIFHSLKRRVNVYWQRWSTDPRSSAIQLLRIAGACLIVCIAASVAMYYHGVPYFRYTGETVQGDETTWAKPTDMAAASYISFPGRMKAVADEYSEGCGWVIWVPIGHIEGLDQKLPFSVFRKADDLFRTEPESNTRQRL